MSWTGVYDSNTSSDFASSLSAVGAGDTLVDGWTDIYGDVWETAGGTLSATIPSSPPSPAYAYLYLSRPSTEDTTDQRMLLTFPSSANGTSHQCYLRWNRETGTANFQGYAFYWDAGSLLIVLENKSGTGTTLASGSVSGYNSGHSYQIDASVQGTTLVLVVNDLTSATQVASISASDATLASGATALTINGSAGAYAQATRVQTFHWTTCGVSPLTAPANTTSTLTVTGVGTSWTSGTTFSLSGGSGASVVSASVNASTQVATLSIATGSATGSITISDSADTATCSFLVDDWYPIYDSNTSSDFAATLPAVGAGAALVNGWTDVYGGVWSTAAGTLSATTPASPPANPYAYLFLSRPPAEDTTDQRMLLTFPSSANGGSHQCYLRWNRQTGTANFQGYAFYWDAGSLLIVLENKSGTGTTLASGSVSGYNSSHSYQIDASVQGTTLVLVVNDLTSATQVASISASDSTLASGATALTINGSAGAYAQATRVETFHPPGMFVYPGSVTLNTAFTAAVSGVGTSWTSGTTFSLSGGSGASITATSVNASTQVATLTIQSGSSAGTLTISDSADAYTAGVAVAGTAVLVSDPGLFFPPQAWFVDGTSYAACNAAGNYFKFAFTGTSATLNLDTSALGGNALWIRASVDGGPFVDMNVCGLSSVALATGLANTLHTITVFFLSRTATIDSWTTTPVPSDSLKVTGLTISSGGVTSAPRLKPNLAIIYGDSRVEGYNSLGVGSQDATIIAAAYLAESLDAEFSLRAFARLGYTVTGWTNVPPLFTPGSDANSSWDKFFAGQSLLVDGKFASQPNFIFVLNLPVNDVHQGSSNAEIEAAVEGLLPALRAAAPAAFIFLNATSWEGLGGAALATAFLSYQQSLAVPDVRANPLPINLTAAEQAAIDISNTNATYLAADGVHPMGFGQALIGASLAQSTQQILGGRRNNRGAA